MPRDFASLIGSCRLAASANITIPSGFSARAWFSPASQFVGLPRPSITLNFQPIFSPLAPYRRRRAARCRSARRPRDRRSSCRARGPGPKSGHPIRSAARRAGDVGLGAVDHRLRVLGANACRTGDMQRSQQRGRREDRPARPAHCEFPIIPRPPLSADSSPTPFPRGNVRSRARMASNIIASI